MDNNRGLCNNDITMCNNNVIIMEESHLHNM